MDIESYVKKVRKLTKYWGTLPPSLPIEVGMIGEISDGGFTRVGDLRQIDEIAPPEVIEYRREVNEAFYDKSSTQIATQAGVDAAPPVAPAGAGVHIDVGFADGDGVFLALAGATYRQVDNVHLLQQQIKSLARKKDKWNPDWVVISHLVEASGVTVIVAEERGASVGLRVQVTLDAFQLFQLADANLGVSVTRSHAVGLQSLAKQGTPLYKTLRLKKGLIRGSRVVLSGVEDVDDPDFVDVPFLTLNNHV
jgi:hypothetical protein